MPLTAQYNIYGVTRLITNQLGCNSNVKMTKKRLPKIRDDCGSKVIEKKTFSRCLIRKWSHKKIKNSVPVRITNGSTYTSDSYYTYWNING